MWVGEDKIGSIGVHVSRGVTTHGFAVNVDNDLQPFEWVVPCGIEHARMTSVCRETGRADHLSCFRKRMAHAFSQAFGRRQRLVSLERLAEREADERARAPHPFAGKPGRRARARDGRRAARSASASQRGSSARPRAARATASCAG